MRSKGQVMSTGITHVVPDRRPDYHVFPMWAHFISLDEELISFCHWQKLPKRELVCFTCLLRCIDHTNVISKLEGTQHSSEDSQNQGAGDLRGMEHRAGKHQAIPVTHHPSAAWASDRFHGLVLATWCLLIIYPYVPGRAHSYESVGVFHFSYTAKAAKSLGQLPLGKEPNILLHMCMC